MQSQKTNIVYLRFDDKVRGSNGLCDLVRFFGCLGDASLRRRNLSMAADKSKF